MWVWLVGASRTLGSQGGLHQKPSFQERSVMAYVGRISSVEVRQSQVRFSSVEVRFSSVEVSKELITTEFVRSCATL